MEAAAAAVIGTVKLEIKSRPTVLRLEAVEDKEVLVEVVLL